jgi:competence protein ComEC
MSDSGQSKTKNKPARLFLYFFVILYLFVPWYRDFSDRELHIYVLDVWQGDAILIRTPERQNILIDLGPDNLVLAKLGETLPFWSRRIDYLVITHAHADHIGAVKDVIERYEIGKIVWFWVEYYSPMYEWLEEYARTYPDLFVDFMRGDSWILEEICFDVLWPTSEFNREKVDNLNNASVVLLMRYKDFSALFMGDAEEDAEAEMLDYTKKVFGKFSLFDGVNFLKSGHHCSKTSSSEEWIELTSPEVAVCSVGEGNTFGHPSNAVLKRYEEHSVKYSRTDLDGRVEVATDGLDYWVNTEKSPTEQVTSVE